MPQASGMIVFNSQGNPVWQSPSINADTVNKIQQRLRHQGCISQELAKTVIKREGKCDIEVHHRLLLTDTDIAIGLLAVVMENKFQSASFRSKADSTEFILETLAMVGQLLCEDFQLNAELSTMALELGDRYEELNLVYSAADQVSNYAESHQAMQRLTDRLVEHLNVGLSCIILDKQKKTFISQGNQFAEEDIKYLVETIKTELLPWVKEKNKTVLINDLGDDIRAEACPAIFFKIICHPLLDARGNVAGLIICVNQHDKVNFTNSDRNLVEVIGRKASKIMLATYDKLTGLLNRSSFEYVIQQKSLFDNYSEQQQTLLLVKINLLHIINELHGLQAGDELIKYVAKLLQGEIREGDIFARFDGDIFGVVLDPCPATNGQIIAQKILTRIEQDNYHIDEEKIAISLNIGLAPLDQGKNGDEVVMNAEMALDMAKTKGRNTFELYDSNNLETQTRQNQMRMLFRIQEAVRKNRFELYGQGIFSLNSKKGLPQHYEILIRLMDEDGGLISPNDFIPAAEKYKLMPIIDRWVLNSLLDELEANWSELEALPTTWAINLSGQSFSDRSFEKYVLQRLQTSAVPANRIGFEITESAAVEHLADAKRFMGDIKKLGCKFYLDDFGTGLSSFAYIKNMNLDYIKIDGVFVKEILNDAVSESLVVAILHVAKTMGIGTVGEYVETLEIRDKLAELNISLGQGYALHKPEPLTQIIAGLIKENTVYPASKKA